jgi:hypothetical protein
MHSRLKKPSYEEDLETFNGKEELMKKHFLKLTSTHPPLKLSKQQTIKKEEDIQLMPAVPEEPPLTWPDEPQTLQT